MSVFSFPRVHVKGLVAVNVGTANNDDYSVYWTDQYQAPLRLADSVNVRAVTYGMSDAEFLSWAQTSQPITQPPRLTQAPNKGEGNLSSQAYKIPAEWNFYGNMGVALQDVSVQSVQTGPDSFAASSPLLGLNLSFQENPSGGSTGMIIDVNPEAVSASQIFADCLSLFDASGGVFLQAKPSKAVTRFVNFQRNTRLNQANGAGACFQCTVALSDFESQPMGEWLGEQTTVGTPAGLVFRYYLFRPLQPINYFQYSTDAGWRAAMEALYAKAQSGKYNNASEIMNPDYIQIIGTLAPWYANEMVSSPVGRILMPTSATVPVPAPPPGQSGGNGPVFQLAPAIVAADTGAGLVSVDCVGTFPDAYALNAADPYNPQETGNNPKFCFVPGQSSDTIDLVYGDGTLTESQPITYTDTADGDRRGWIFDLPIKLPQLNAGEFSLVHNKFGALLQEQEYFIASDQACLYAEQGGPTGLFLSGQYPLEPATLRVFQRGVELEGAVCPPVTVWSYASTPNQQDSPLVQLPGTVVAGEPLTIPTANPGTYLLTFTLPGQPSPPPSEGADQGNLPVGTMAQINIRVLPTEDYTRFYEDPNAPAPVGNSSLTWEVVYNEVLRNYYLLYPGMSLVISLNDEQQWNSATMARLLLAYTDTSVWETYNSMPRTRDLSASRRTLLQAWARTFLSG